MLPVMIDIHTHSIASGHATTDTITDMAKEANKKGIQLLAITEHGPATTGSCKQSYFRNLMQAPKKRCGTELLYGCEVNIMDCKGRLDLEDQILQELDINIASLHTQNIKPGTIDDNNSAVIAAIRNPNIHIIGHPDDEKYGLNNKLILKEAMKHHVLLELNNSSLRTDGYRGNTRENDIKYLTLCKYNSYPIIIGSDSHGKDGIGCFEEALKLLNQLEFPEELILNYHVDLFKSWLYKKRHRA